MRTQMGIQRPYIDSGALELPSVSDLDVVAEIAEAELRQLSALKAAWAERHRQHQQPPLPLMSAPPDVRAAEPAVSWPAVSLQLECVDAKVKVRLASHQVWGLRAAHAHAQAGLCACLAPGPRACFALR
jgi:hypothetical protein